MREIKFDVLLWDGENPTTIEHYSFEEAISEDFISFENGALIPTDSSVIIREYTGLKDKNGNEIYEGDIIHKDRWGGQKDIVGEVIWHIVGYAVKVKGAVAPYAFSGGDFSDSEVIGNIYENPELISK